MKDFCENCPLRLYNTKGYCLSGVGDPYHGNLIVIPNVDYKGYKAQDISFSNQVKIITDVISSTGVLEKVYIVPLIRCNETISCEVDQTIINRCINWTNRDITIYEFKRILLLGSAVDRILHSTVKYTIDKYISGKQFLIETNYSPLIKYTNDELYKVFKSKLISWYNEAINKIYTKKEIIRYD